MESSSTTKIKPPSHAFRVSTDAVRQEYRRNRAAALGGDIERRKEVAAGITSHAAVTVTREAGFTVCPPGTVGDLAAVIESAREIVARADLEQKRAKANKPFLMKLLATESLGEHSAILRFALRQDIVASAAKYLGMVPILQFANVLYSSHVADEPAKSQLYHCDSDETEQVKVFVLCESVTPDTGPLTFLTASQSQVIRDRVGYRYKTRLTDDAARDAAGDRLDETALVGPPGTTAFLDTSRCFHYGSRFRDTSARRVVVMLQYITPLAFILPEEDYREGTTFRQLARSGHDELTRMVLGVI